MFADVNTAQVQTIALTANLVKVAAPGQIHERVNIEICYTHLSAFQTPFF
ncbi:hypothetical protein [Mycolicibacterium goodii]